jgi:cell filamentation protein
MTESTDPYLYPGTDVLKNLRGIRDSNILTQFEAESTTRRIVQLIESPVKCQFDAVCLRAIHKHIFQDVYSWAGQFRTVNISKGGHPFAAAAFIEPALDAVLRKLSEENYMRKTNPPSFARRAGFFLGEINAVHPFREGNGRTQREFIRELGLRAGLSIDWSRITQDKMMVASRESFRSGDCSGLAALISASFLDG